MGKWLQRIEFRGRMGKGSVKGASGRKQKSHSCTREGSSALLSRLGAEGVVL